MTPPNEKPKSGLDNKNQNPSDVTAGLSEARQDRADFKQEMQKYAQEHQASFDSLEGSYVQIIDKYNLTETPLEELSDANLVDSYKEFKKLGDSNDDVDFAMRAIKAELLARVDIKMKKEFENFVKKYEKQGLFTLTDNTEGLTGAFLVYTSKYSELTTKVESGKASDSEQLLYASVQHDLLDLQTSKFIYLDKANEMICDDSEKSFYQAMEYYSSGDLYKAKELLLGYKKGKASKDEMLDTRASDALKSIAYAEIELLHGRIDGLITAASLNTLQANRSTVDRIVESQKVVLNLSKKLIETGRFLDLSSALEALKMVKSKQDLVLLIDPDRKGDNIVFLATAADMYGWGDGNNGFSFWLGGFHDRLSTDRNPRFQEYDLLRGYKDDGSVSEDELQTPKQKENNEINWDKLQDLDSKGEHPQSAALWKKHFSMNDFYKKFSNVYHQSYDEYRRDFEKNPKNKEKLEDDIKDYLHGLYLKGQLEIYYGKGADKDADEWFKEAKNPKLYSIMLQLKENFIESYYERHLHEEVIMKDWSVKSIYNYWDKVRGIGATGNLFGSEKEAYEKIVKEGFPLNIYDTTASYGEYSNRKRPLTDDEKSMLQFCIYDDMYKEQNNQWGPLGFFRMTAPEWNQFKTNLPVDIIGIIVSAGLSMEVGKTVANSIAKKLLDKAELEGLASLVKRQGVAVAVRTALKESVARIPGFMVEVLVFQVSEMVINQFRSGPNGRVLTDWKNNFLKEYGRTAMTLGVLRGTGMMSAKYLTGAKAGEGLLKRGARALVNGTAMTGVDTVALTGSSIGYDYLIGEHFDEDDLGKLARNNVMMSIGVRAGHYAVNVVGGNLPGGRRTLTRGQIKLTEDSIKNVPGEDPLTKSEVEFLAGTDLARRGTSEKGWLKGDSMSDGLTPNEARNLIETLKTSPQIVDVWGKADLNTRKELLRKLNTLRAGAEKLSRDDLLKGLSAGDETYVRIVKILLLNSPDIPLTAQDLMKFQEKDPRFLDDVLFIKIGKQSMNLAKDLAKLFFEKFSKEHDLNSLFEPLRNVSDIEGFKKGMEKVQQALVDLCNRARISPSVLFLTILLLPRPAAAAAGPIDWFFNRTTQLFENIFSGTVGGLASGVAELIGTGLVFILITNGVIIGGEKLISKIRGENISPPPLESKADALEHESSSMPTMVNPDFKTDVPPKVQALINSKNKLSADKQNLISLIDQCINLDFSDPKKGVLLRKIAVIVSKPGLISMERVRRLNDGQQVIDGTADLRNELQYLREKTDEEKSKIDDEITALNMINPASFRIATLRTTLKSITDALSKEADRLKGIYPKLNRIKTAEGKLDLRLKDVVKHIETLNKTIEELNKLYDLLSDPKKLMEKRDETTPPKSIRDVINDINSEIKKVETKLNNELQNLLTTITKNPLTGIPASFIDKHLGPAGQWLVHKDIWLALIYVAATMLSGYYGHSKSNQQQQQQQQQEQQQEKENVSAANADELIDYFKEQGINQKTLQGYDLNRFIREASDTSQDGFGDNGYRFSQLTDADKKKVFDALRQ